MSQIYEHDDKASSLFPHLIHHLPHSISLLRRIQHGIAYPAPTAKILASFPPSSPGTSAPDPSPNQPWLAARVDLSRGRETQIIIYSSLEAEHTSIQPIAVSPHGNPGPSPSSTTLEHATYKVATISAEQTHLDLVRDQFLALLAYIKANMLPEYLASLPEAPATTELNSPNGVALIPAPDPHAFLIGSLHTGLFNLLLKDAIYPSTGADNDAANPISKIKVHRFDNPPYGKFFFRRDAFTVSQDGVETENHLPAGYRFHDRKGRKGVLDSHLDLVQSRTHIPRSRAQLSSIPGVAIYSDAGPDSGDEEMPIAWAFLGVDGALATLHVEPEHRGRGLALALSKETMRKGMDAEGVFGAARLALDQKLAERSADWVHTEVAHYNQASRRVMEKVGGEEKTFVMWSVIELCD
ncbi:Acyl-CoA N-acyltransferase [Penicillium angulare]|uniref:Acyl-CoA N-acyltransferase n=1 Tax=Penicillium angulare TaxID=116970 RepID=UPI002540553B|nr:Acyl-CoA N-acyltransferase [Penicillium angulare]KAJ5288598.1 Acyl-CoA N-acyltransferase [Penicillium angulare]